MKAVAGVLLALWCALAAAAVTVRDDRGVDVTLREPPRRIVTLLPSLTETVCALGACDRLVGIDDWSNWPAQVNALPRLGGVADFSIERVVALRPDVVLLSSTARALPRLQALGVPVLGLDIKTLADVRRVSAIVGDALQVAGAPALWQRVESGIDAAAPQPAAFGQRGTTVYFEISDGPYAASESSHIGELLRRLGAVNIVPGRLGTVPKLNPEFVVRADPQVVMLVGTRRAIARQPARLVAPARAARRPRLHLHAGAGRRHRASRSAPRRRRARAGRLPGRPPAEDAVSARRPRARCACHARRLAPPAAGRRCARAGDRAAGAGRRLRRVGGLGAAVGRPRCGRGDPLGHPPAAQPGRVARRCDAGPRGRGRAGAVPQSARRSLPAGQRDRAPRSAWRSCCCCWVPRRPARPPGGRIWAWRAAASRARSGRCWSRWCWRAACSRPCGCCWRAWSWAWCSARSPRW